MRSICIFLLLLVNSSALFATNKGKRPEDINHFTYSERGSYIEGKWVHNTTPIKLQFGMYITDLFNLSWHNESFDIAFWGWFIHDDPNLRPTLSLEVVNSMYSYLDFPSTIDLNNGTYWSSAKFRVGVSQNWDLSNFPFVSQKLQLWMESAHEDVNLIEYSVDTDNSGIDPDVWLPGWEVESFELFPVVKTYHTNFGATLRGSDKSEFSRVVCEIVLKSDSGRKFFKIFGIMYLSVFLALCVFFVPPGELSSKVGFVVASVFAAIGNKTVLDSYLPPIGSMTLVNKLELLTFSCLGLTAVITVITAWLNRNRYIKTARVVDFAAAIVLLCIFTILNYLWIGSAAHGYFS